MDVKTIIHDILQQNKIHHCVWVAAGGSYGGFYPAQYFMEHEATTIQSHAYTSQEFVLASPKFVNENTLAVFCSMRGTPETCEAAKVAKQLGATTLALYVNESDLTEICDYKIQIPASLYDNADTLRLDEAMSSQFVMHN